MESARVITSKIYGDLGRFTATRRPNLHRSPSGRVYVLGQGALGGKGEGTLFLDQAADSMGFRVPGRSLVVCDDYFGIPARDEHAIGELDPQKSRELMDILGEENFPARLAIRSSSVMEDQPGHSAAGRFLTKYHDTQGPKSDLAADLLEVINSNYEAAALFYQRSQGMANIPPLPVIIQELVGNEFEYAPRYFFPALSGIINTASPGKIKVATVSGLGVAAVGGRGLLHTFNHSLAMPERRGGVPNFIEAIIDGRETRFDSKERAKETVERLSPATQKELARIALKLQREISAPLDIEWALDREGNTPHLLQVRPINPKQRIPKPDISTDRTLLLTSKVVGQASCVFNHICVLDSPGFFGYPDNQLLKKLESYPDSILICRILVTEITPRVLSRILPYIKALVVLDYFQEHFHGTGLDHIALFAADEKKVILYSGEEVGFLDQLIRRAKLIEKTSLTSVNEAKDILRIFELPEPHTIAGSDEDGWGMVYRG